MQGSPRESLRSCLEAQRASVSILELLALAAQDGRASFERVKPAPQFCEASAEGLCAPLRASARLCAGLARWCQGRGQAAAVEVRRPLGGLSCCVVRAANKNSWLRVLEVPREATGL